MKCFRVTLNFICKRRFLSVYLFSTFSERFLSPFFVHKTTKPQKGPGLSLGEVTFI